MKLKDMKRSGKDMARHTKTLTDEQGAPDYEITITGTSSLVQKVFEKSDFEIIIDTKATERDAERRAKELWEKHSGTVEEAAPAADVESLRKSAPKEVTKQNAIVVSIRRTRGEGTFFALWLPLLAIPKGVSLFVVGLPAVICQGSVFPMVGDTDLFLTLNGPLPPNVSVSSMGGLAIDTVTFGVAPSPAPRPVIPFYRLFGFSNTVTGFYCWSI